MRRSVRTREWPLIDRALAKAAAYGFREQRLAPDFRAAITVEVMSPHFTKYHLGRGYALHSFEDVDPGPPHDHPCDFTTLILEPYVDDVYTVDHVGWTRARVAREAGEEHAVAASTIHQIVALPGGESGTLVQYGPHLRTSRFYRFGEIVESRSWRERKWRIAPASSPDHQGSDVCQAANELARSEHGTTSPARAPPVGARSGSGTLREPKLSVLP